MFCPKCGKKNEDNSLFCTWCGAGFGSVSVKSLSASPEQPAMSAPTPPEPEAEKPAETLQTVPADAPSVSAENREEAPQTAYSVPTPGVIPQSSEVCAPSAPQPEVPAPDARSAPENGSAALTYNNEIPIDSMQKPEKERRCYTGVHIAICLAAAGIMAAAAGIFAGLYFSVIL